MKPFTLRQAHHDRNTMDSNEIRKRFLDFFKSKGHSVLSSDSLVPADDPSLLFTGAGMNQFKDYFLGLKKDLKRAASCQKCFRTGDVEQVGQTASHLTFFEMLGNFSFGDYFKKEACCWGWEFLTKELKIPAERLCVTVYEWDKEAAQIWKNEVGLPHEKIFRSGAKDNFWPSNAPTEGPNGPCGPCSEIHYDTGCCTVGKVCPSPDDCRPGCPCGRFVEVWNLVFTQYDRQPDGSLKDLPARNIDTGMGLERLTVVLQDKRSVFETDLFEPILKELAFALRQTQSERKAPASVLCAIADHARALTFLVGDGVVPSNEGRGYVLRMLLRKAERAGIALGFTKPFLYSLIPVAVRKMEPVYPELGGRGESIAQVILSEEEKFHQMLVEKLPLLREEIRGTVRQAHHDRNTFSAESAARFYDTHGLSYEEIAEVCRQEKAASPSRDEFEEALTLLQAKSKAASGFSKSIFARDELLGLVKEVPPTQFIGYSDLTGRGSVLALIQDNRFVPEVKSGEKVGLILDRTPFYGEAGGQVGDTGLLEGPSGKLEVLDTQWAGSVLVHQAEVVEGRLKKGDHVAMSVDPHRRHSVAQNHTGTHLLHAALRKVLGAHVMQAGSLVAPDHLRFDFSHPRKVSQQELKAVESLANEWVKKNPEVKVQQMTLEEARRAGAAALFGEKYGQNVRVVTIGDVSKELCGGTHLSAGGQVGLLTIVEEGSVAAGMRRVQALTGREAELFLKSEAVRLSEGKERSLKRAEEKEREDQLQKQKVKEAQAQAKQAAREKVGAFSFFGVKFDQPMGPAALRSSADVIRQSDPEAVLFLADGEGFCVASSGGTAQKQGIGAQQLLNLATEIAGGSGGGRPDMAQGRLKEPARFAEVRGQMVKFIQERSK
ncbi:MAG: alanine--tRNA ligase [Candidatus Omnitrophica bacterium]|nr:alanine--tRNA ligase [Candidatus Omnitrophota bacterium]